MGEPFVDGPIYPSVRQLFSEELFGTQKRTGDGQEGSGISKPGSHFTEGFFGALKRGRDLAKVFRRIPEANVQWLETQYFGIEWRVVESLHNGPSGPECRLEFEEGVHHFLTEESWRCSSELGRGWEVKRCRAQLRTKGAGDTLKAGKEQERMASRLIATRQFGCRRPRRIDVEMLSRCKVQGGSAQPIQH
jgi:hypothetical protein